MNANRDDGYREGLVALLGGIGFVVLGLAAFSERLGVQAWYFYGLGVGIIVVMAMFLPRDRSGSWPRYWLVQPAAALLISIVVAALSADITFPALFPLVFGLLGIVLGLWLLFQRSTPAGGAGR